MKVERRGVVELLAGDRLRGPGSTFSILALRASQPSRAPAAFVGSSTQSRRRSTVERQDHLAVLGLLVVAAQQVGDRPDEGRVVVDTSLCHPDLASWRNGRRLRPRSLTASTT